LPTSVAEADFEGIVIYRCYLSRINEERQLAKAK